MDKEINRQIKTYKNNLELLGIKIKKIILYGSYAQGKAKKDSDIDLLVISNDFKDMDLWERLSLLGRARLGINRPMEIIGMTEDEYVSDEMGSFIKEEVKDKGVSIV